MLGLSFYEKICLRYTACYQCYCRSKKTFRRLYNLIYMDIKLCIIAEKITLRSLYAHSTLIDNHSTLTLRS
ncbi:hypothetical protein T4D_14133 [Trichinella pseudospiralis]|uniref:Uncharacterized protein n=1 Tax=Trichinella pseudospiralis TaxID=6337 RepID=A0A0V1DRF0_TRIPS|nr:hypothetical protein T4D_14133 [Trichinella pseudospiralis]